jgi:hypothetical protein
VRRRDRAAIGAAGAAPGDFTRRTDVAGDVGLRIDEISANLGKLITMHTDVRRMRERIVSLRQQNASGVWPDIDEVSDFARRYDDALRDCDRELLAISGEIESCRVALAESARALQAQDAEVHARLVALANALETAGYATRRPMQAV